MEPTEGPSNPAIPARCRQFCGHEDLKVYQKAVALEARVHELVKTLPYPKEARLRDQLDRCSASVAVQIAEGYADRNKPVAFVAKLRISDGEAKETRKWLETAHLRGYLSTDALHSFLEGYQEIGRMLGGMMKCPERFQSKAG